MKIIKEDLSINGKIQTLVSMVIRIQTNNKFVEEKHWAANQCLKDNYVLCQALSQMANSLQEDIKKLIN